MQKLAWPAKAGEGVGANCDILFYAGQDIQNCRVMILCGRSMMSAKRFAGASKGNFLGKSFPLYARICVVCSLFVWGRASFDMFFFSSCFAFLHFDVGQTWPRILNNEGRQLMQKPCLGKGSDPIALPAARQTTKVRAQDRARDGRGWLSAGDRRAVLGFQGGKLSLP